MIAKRFAAAVLQPTSLCNLDCSYCYLSSRDKNLRMMPIVASKVAEAISQQNAPWPVDIIWHGGEPMASGIDHLRSLVTPFEQLREEGKVIHFIQTNATLINREWCNFFQEYGFKVGVSIDGPEWANTQRKNWSNKPAFNDILRGISVLQSCGIDFSAIAVVSRQNVERARELYDFFCGLGCSSVGFNVEEIEGLNSSRGRYQPSEEMVRRFWEEIFESWVGNPALEVREIDRFLSYSKAVLQGSGESWKGYRNKDPFPTVAWNGDVSLLSPELAGNRSEVYHDFVVGNVLQNSLVEIVAEGREARYVTDFAAGVEECKAVCPYFDFCGGGQASNKFFEHGTTNATITSYCRNSYQLVSEAILDSLPEEEVALAEQTP